MSLLLDALKKAAEQKARQAEEADESTQTSVDTVMLDETETYVVTPDDNTTIIDENTELRQDDETDVDLFHEDETEIVEEDSTEVFQEDETEIIQEDSTEVLREDETQALEESTEILEEETEVHIIDTSDETGPPSSNEDETMSLLSNEDVSEFLGDFDSLMANPPQQHDVTEANVQQHEDEEISLNLVDNSDDTTVKAPDEWSADDASLTLSSQGDSTTTAGLELIDYDKGQGEQTETIRATEEATITGGVALESLRNENTILRQDATSTHTYAPDNYDRTLIKPANDDASRIFAGMKSEDDVLMTPDYAKRVFLSKSSANRVQHYKVYVGIAVSILLAIGIFSLFELQSEYDRIDTALMPLKRDPMPGVIRSQTTDTSTNLFEKSVAPEISNQTLQIIESAGLTASDSLPENSNQAEVGDDSANVEAVESTQTEETTGDSKADSAQQTETAEVEEKPQVIASRTVETKPARTTANQNTQTGSKTTLKITSNSEYTDKDQWLKEAYQAYQRGDDKTALQKYNQVLSIDPDNRNALLARAAIAIQNNNSVAAIKDYQKLLLANPKDSLAMSSFIAVTNISPEKSESQLKLMIREEPSSPYLNFALGNIYGAQNRWQEAQSLYFKALENNPDDPNYAYNLAVSLEHLAKPKVAIAYYERALLNIENSLATFNKEVVDRRLEMLRRL